MTDMELEARLEARGRRRRAEARRRKRRRENLLRLIFLLLLTALLLTVMAKALRSRQGESAAASLELSVSEPSIYVLPALGAEDSALEEDDGLVCLGTFQITHYCPCGVCCGAYADGVTASGTEATEGRTLAVDPEVIPYGSRVAIFYDDGRIEHYIAEDCGGAIHGKEADVFVSDHQQALELGVTSGTVYLEGAA